MSTNQSSTLARRLAEAADGLRNTDPVYFVAGYAFPHSIKDFPDYSSAEAYLKENKYSLDDFGIFGPYQTKDDLENYKLVDIREISKVTLIVHFKDGTERKISLPGGIDSIFFNLSAFEKFVFPYYCHLFGVEYAKELRDALIAAYKESPKDAYRLPAAPRPHSYLTYTLNLLGDLGEPLT
jgi:hypothetical protein